MSTTRTGTYRSLWDLDLRRFRLGRDRRRGLLLGSRLLALGSARRLAVIGLRHGRNIQTLAVAAQGDVDAFIEQYEEKTSPHYRNQKQRFAKRRKKEAVQKTTPHAVEHPA